MLTRPKNHQPIPWRHGVVSTPLFTAATVYLGGVTLGTAQDLGGTLPLELMGIGSATGIISAAAARYLRSNPARPAARWFHTGFTATWTTATYAWLNWTAHGTPWSLASAGILAAATAAIAPFYAIDRGLRAEQIAAQWAAEEAEYAPADRNEWEHLFHNAGARGVQVGTPTDTRAGYALPLTLTETPFEALLPLLRIIEVRKGDLRPGALSLVRGASGLASDAVLNVATRDVLAETLDLPDDAHPITITEPITLGMLESGEPLEIRFRQNCIFIAGKKGSGKSVMLHVIIAALTRCTDAVIWMIDLAQGNTAKRWLRPWVQGWKDTRGRLIDRPILDWVAADPEEAVRLLQAAVAVGDGRARRMKGGKIRPTRTLPALIVITDENPELMAWNPTAVQAKTRGVKKGRKAAVDYIDAGQRGTGPNTGGGEINSQYDTIFGGYFPKKAEGQFVFPDYYNQIDLSKLPGPGSFLVLDEKRRRTIGPEKTKIHYAYDDDEYPDGTEATVIEELAVARWDIRPDLDKDSQEDAAPYGYHDRWTNPDRVEWLCDALGVNIAGQTTKPRTRKPSPTTGQGLTTLTPLPPLESYLEKYKDWKPGQQPTPAPAGQAPADPVVEKAIADALEEFERINEEATVSLTKTTSKNDRRHPRRDQVTDWVREAGDEGITVADVRTRLLALYPDEKPPSDTAIQNWYATHPNITKPGRARYFWADTAGE